MSLMSILGKVGKAALNLGTGGISGTLMDSIGGASRDAGNVLGGQIGGANNARYAQGQLNQGGDRNAIDLYAQQQKAQNDAADTDLARQQFAQNSRGVSAKQALIGQLLGGGLTPTSIKDGVASGGLMRSLNGNPDALAAMKTLGSQASTAQNTPLQFAGGQMMTAPTLTQVPKLDAGGSTLSRLAQIAQIFGAVAPYLHKTPQGDQDGN